MNPSPRNIIENAGAQLSGKRAASSEQNRVEYCAILDRLAGGQAQDDDTAQLARLMASLGIDQAKAAADLKLIKARRQHALDLDALKAQAKQLGDMNDLQAQLEELDADLKVKIGAMLKPKAELITKIDELYSLNDNIDYTTRNTPREINPTDEQANRLAPLLNA